MLLAIERCALGSRYLDLQTRYHVQHSVIRRGINFFAHWLKENWGYLLRDYMLFWGGYLEASMMAIRRKMLNQYHDDVDELEPRDKKTVYRIGERHGITCWNRSFMQEK